MVLGKVDKNYQFLAQQPIDGQCLPSAAFPSTCLQTEVNNHPTSLGVTCYQHIKPLSRCWITRTGLKPQANNSPRDRFFTVSGINELKDRWAEWLNSNLAAQDPAHICNCEPGNTWRSLANLIIHSINRANTLGLRPRCNKVLSLL